MARSLQPVAGVDVGDRHGEEDKADRQHDDVHHGNSPSDECTTLPVDALRAPRALESNQESNPAAQLSVHSHAIRCHASHMNSRGRQPPRYRNLIKIGRTEDAYSALIKSPAICSGFFMGFDAMFGI